MKKPCHPDPCRPPDCEEVHGSPDAGRGVAVPGGTDLVAIAMNPRRDPSPTHPDVPSVLLANGLQWGAG